MRKGLFIAALIGWGFALLVSPRDVVGWFRGRSA